MHDLIRKKNPNLESCVPPCKLAKLISVLGTNLTQHLAVVRGVA